MAKSSKATKSPTTIPDRDITAAVERRLRRNTTIPADGIDVRTDIGAVTLTGSVDSLLAKDLAATVARETKGVRSVVNRLAVKGDARTDEQVKRDVEQALVSDPAADGYEVTVVVADGVVTLTGTVQSMTERDLTERLARGVRGVTDVSNRVVVKGPADRPDSEIAPDVRSRLAWDRQVDDARINVEVENGRVILRGTVGSAAERLQAYSDSWVVGAKAVDIDGLKVDQWWDRDGLRRDPKTVARSDAEIERAVRDALMFDPRVLSFNPTVSVRDGVVTLTGTAENLAAKRAAGQDARNTVGVWRVRNYLKVRPGRILTDENIVRAIRLALGRDPYVDRYQIRVTSYNGYVHLTGTVDSYTERARAEDIASRVNGVVDVRNYLVVDYPLRMVPAVPDITARDNEIKDDILDEMFWSPFVQADEVVVTVRDGVATLTGFVDTWEERAAATENAYEGGARKVINELKVRSD
jgi:osmotically-inducible protein OsmY